MFRPAMSLLAVALTLSLAACSPGPNDAADAPAAPSDAATAPAEPVLVEESAPFGEDPCNADAVQSLIGQEATDTVVEQARIDAGAQVARTLAPGQVVTMEFHEGRLNVDVDEAGTITGLRCG